jgi:protein disulfide-isomerase
MIIEKEFNKFEELLSSIKLPVLADFYNDSCESCLTMAPILEELDAQMKKQLQVVKINTDSYPELAAMHHIQVIPTLVLFKQGKPVDRIHGIMSAEALIQRLQALV